MSSHFLLQHVQIFLANNARRQPTIMTEKRTNFRRYWDTSLNLCNEPIETKMIFTLQFYITDVKCTSSNMHLSRQPYFSTSHHQRCLQCHLSTLHSQRFRIKLILQWCTWKFPAFLGSSAMPGGFRQKPVSAEKEKPKVKLLSEEKMTQVFSVKKNLFFLSYFNHAKLSIFWWANLTRIHSFLFCYCMF